MRHGRKETDARPATSSNVELEKELRRPLFGGGHQLLRHIYRRSPAVVGAARLDWLAFRKGSQSTLAGERRSRVPFAMYSAIAREGCGD